MLAVVLAVAAGVRLSGLGGPGYTNDEYWKAELADGRGSVHLHLPLDRVMDHPPDPFDRRAAAAGWHVWTHMEATHPPLYYVLLRLWTDGLGTADATERAFSAVASVLAVAVLWDAVRVLHGREAARWAAALMAVAAPQVAQGRLTSNYAMEVLWVLAAADAVARLRALGPTVPRAAGLSVAALAAVLTHYFAVGPLVGLFGYTVVALRGRARQAAVAAFAVAAVAFVLCWGPFMWGQRHLFATDDPATRFLVDPDSAGHVRHVLLFAAAVPVAMLGELPTAVAVGGAVVGAVVGLVVYALPWAVGRRRPGVGLWGGLLVGTVGLIVGLDLTRGTQHAAFTRYLVAAGPAVCAIVPVSIVAVVRSRWAGRAIVGGVLVVTALASPQAYRTELPDPRPLTDDLRRAAGPRDLIVVASTGDDRAFALTAYLLLARYLHPIPAPVAIETGPPGPTVRAAAARADHVFVVPLGVDPRTWFPGLSAEAVKPYRGGLSLWVLDRPASTGAAAGGR